MKNEVEEKSSKSKNMVELLNFTYNKHSFSIKEGPYGPIVYVEKKGSKKDITYYSTIEGAINYIIHNFSIRKETVASIEQLLSERKEEEMKIVKVMAKEIRKLQGVDASGK